MQKCDKIKAVKQYNLIKYGHSSRYLISSQRSQGSFQFDLKELDIVLLCVCKDKNCKHIARNTEFIK